LSICLVSDKILQPFKITAGFGYKQQVGQCRQYFGKGSKRKSFHTYQILGDKTTKTVSQFASVFLLDFLRTFSIKTSKHRGFYTIFPFRGPFFVVVIPFTKACFFAKRKLLNKSDQFIN